MRVLIAAIAVSFGCGAAPPPPAPPPPQPVPVAAPEPLPRVVKPAGYVQVRIAGVLPDDASGTLILHHEESKRAVPVWIGGTEAYSIQLRLRGEAPPRPLTHDLFDAAIAKLGGEIVKVQVDALRGGTYHGSVYIRAGRRVHRLDARPSDAIALAIGNVIPIYVAETVLDAEGIPYDPDAAQLPMPTP